jgi:hypothetical protein
MDASNLVAPAAEGEVVGMELWLCSFGLCRCCWLRLVQQQRCGMGMQLLAAGGAAYAALPGGMAYSAVRHKQRVLVLWRLRWDMGEFGCGLRLQQEWR